MRVKGPVEHEIRFTPGKSYQGLELRYFLEDEAGAILHRDTLRVGPLFEGKSYPLQSGTLVRRRLAFEEGPLKYIERFKRKRAVKGSFDFESLRHIRLDRAFICEKEEYEWQEGLPIPEDVQEPPRVGTVFERIRCNENPISDDAQLINSVHYERVLSGNRVSIDADLLFHKSYPRGVQFSLKLFTNRDEAVLPKCRIVVEHPPIFAGNTLSLNVDLTVDHLAQSLLAVSRMRVLDLIERPSFDGKVRTDLKCN